MLPDLHIYKAILVFHNAWIYSEQIKASRLVKWFFFLISTFWDRSIEMIQKWYYILLLYYSLISIEWDLCNCWLSSLSPFAVSWNKGCVYLFFKCGSLWGYWNPWIWVTPAQNKRFAEKNSNENIRKNNGINPFSKKYICCLSVQTRNPSPLVARSLVLIVVWWTKQGEVEGLLQIEAEGLGDMAGPATETKNPWEQWQVRGRWERLWARKQRPGVAPSLLGGELFGGTRTALGLQEWKQFGGGGVFRSCGRSGGSIQHWRCDGSNDGDRKLIDGRN